MQIIEPARKPAIPAPPPIWTPPLLDIVVDRLTRRHRVSREHARVIISLYGLGPREVRP